ncbi:MAG: site-specific integrase [Microcystis sp.]|uniref:site-specific integrase n=1 Tax=Microcystis sp. TaxID=1127 RepID=UPI00391A9771
MDWIKRYLLFHRKKHPREMGKEEIKSFLTHLAVDKNVAAATQNQALNAILFLSSEVSRQLRGRNLKRDYRVRTISSIENRRTPRNGDYRCPIPNPLPIGVRL